jgi:hypothetical protein
MWMYGDHAGAARAASRPACFYSDLKACNDAVFRGRSPAAALFVLGKHDLMTAPKECQGSPGEDSSIESVLVETSGHTTVMVEGPDATLGTPWSLSFR